MDITETDKTRSESDKASDPAADSEDLANAPKSTEVDEGDNGKQDISHTEAEGDHQTDQQFGALNHSRDGKNRDKVMKDNSLEDNLSEVTLTRW